MAIVVGSSMRLPGILPNMHGLIVETARRVIGLSGPIDGQVGQQHVFRKSFLQVAIAVAPGSEFFDNPRSQPGRRIIKPIREV